MPRGWGAPRTGEMVRDHLLVTRGDSIYSTWKAVKQLAEDKGYVPPTYSSMRVLFYILRKLGLVRKVRQEPAMKKGYYRKSIYAVVPGMEDAEEWIDPSTAYYRPRRWEERRKAWLPIK